MTTRAVTGWFPPECKPAREGVYEVLPKHLIPDHKTRYYAWWDVKRQAWRPHRMVPGECSIIQRFKGVVILAAHQDKYWRGCTAPQE